VAIAVVVCGYASLALYPLDGSLVLNVAILVVAAVPGSNLLITVARSAVFVVVVAATWKVYLISRQSDQGKVV
jgi:hypothetical protein